MIWRSVPLSNRHHFWPVFSSVFKMLCSIIFLFIADFRSWMRVGLDEWGLDGHVFQKSTNRWWKRYLVQIKFWWYWLNFMSEQIKKLCNWLRWGGASLAPCVLAKIDQGGSSAPLSHCLGQCAISLVTSAWDNHSSGGRLFGNQPGWISLAAPTKQNSCYWSAEGVARVWREWHLSKVSRVHIWNCNFWHR